MEYRRLGDTDMMVSAVTFGCWAVGAGAEWGNPLSDGAYARTLETAVSNGINFFDTASAYGMGHSEEVVGRTLGKVREKVFISSKASAAGLVRDHAEASVDASLKRLGTSYIDVYFIHWPHPDIPVEEPVEQLMKLKEAGKIRAIGVSNFTLAHMKRAVKAGKIDVLQPCYSLYWRHIEKDLLGFCRDKGIGVITYSSIAQGLLTGKFNRDWKFDDTDMRKDGIPLFQGDVYQKALENTGKIMEIGKKYGKTGAQTAINWLIHTEGVTSAIVGAKTPEQVLENVGACGFSLSGVDRQIIGDLGMEVAGMVADWDTMYRKNDERLVLKT
ncbi:MAG: aldo/keto reductase [Clostridia bacterium]